MKLKLKFFPKVKRAIFNIEDYQDFSIEKSEQPIMYALKLMLIFTIIIFIFISYKSYKTLNEIYNNLKETKSDFYFENNKLISDEEYTIFSDSDNIISVVIITQDKAIDKNESNIYIIASSDKLKIEYNGVTFLDKTYEEVSKYYSLNGINKDSILSYLGTKDFITVYIGSIIIIGILIYIEFTLQLLFSALMLSILGYIITRITIIKFRFKPVWNMSIYALTLPTILYLIYIVLNLCTGFAVKYFSFAYDAISYIYLITAILMIKTTLIKQQIEVSKIVEEQKKIKEENNEEKEEKPKGDKKKKEKKPEDNPEQEPSGNEV